MSTASYKKNPSTLRIVYYTFTLGGIPQISKFVCYEKTDEAAEQAARQHLVWASAPSFFILGIKTLIY